MDSKHTLPISEARKRIFEIAEEVQQPDTYYVLTEKGKPKAVILSMEEFESFLETIGALEDFPDFEKDIKELERDKKSGAYEGYPTLEEILAKEGFVVADKVKEAYGVRHKTQATSKKRTGKTSRKR